jgi:hypothetical protein
VTELAFGTVTDMKNGKAIRIWTYLDPQEALEAAGAVGVGPGPLNPLLVQSGI